MSKKVIKSSNKNEKYNLKSVLDTDNIMSSVSLKTVTTIGCASVIASCSDSGKGGDKGDKDKWEALDDDLKKKFNNDEELFKKFINKCKDFTDDDLTNLIKKLDKENITKVIESEENITKGENGSVKIGDKTIEINEQEPEEKKENEKIKGLEYDKLSSDIQEKLKNLANNDENLAKEFWNKIKNEENIDKSINDDDDLKNKYATFKTEKEDQELIKNQLTKAKFDSDSQSKITSYISYIDNTLNIKIGQNNSTANQYLLGQLKNQEEINKIVSGIKNFYEQIVQNDKIKDNIKKQLKEKIKKHFEKLIRDEQDYNGKIDIKDITFADNERVTIKFSSNKSVQNPQQAEHTIPQAFFGIATDELKCVEIKDGKESEQSLGLKRLIDAENNAFYNYTFSENDKTELNKLVTTKEQTPPNTIKAKIETAITTEIDKISITDKFSNDTTKVSDRLQTFKNIIDDLLKGQITQQGSNKIFIENLQNVDAIYEAMDDGKDKAKGKTAFEGFIKTKFDAKRKEIYDFFTTTTESSFTKNIKTTLSGVQLLDKKGKIVGNKTFIEAINDKIKAVMNAGTYIAKSNEKAADPANTPANLEFKPNANKTDIDDVTLEIITAFETIKSETKQFLGESNLDSIFGNNITTSGTIKYKLIQTLKTALNNLKFSDNGAKSVAKIIQECMDSNFKDYNNLASFNKSNLDGKLQDSTATAISDLEGATVDNVVNAVLKGVFGNDALCKGFFDALNTLAQVQGFKNVNTNTKKLAEANCSLANIADATAGTLASSGNATAADISAVIQALKPAVLAVGTAYNAWVNADDKNNQPCDEIKALLKLIVDDYQSNDKFSGVGVSAAWVKLGNLLVKWMYVDSDNWGKEASDKAIYEDNFRKSTVGIASCFFNQVSKYANAAGANPDNAVGLIWNLVNDTKKNINLFDNDDGIGGNNIDVGVISKNIVWHASLTDKDLATTAFKIAVKAAKDQFSTNDQIVLKNLTNEKAGVSDSVYVLLAIGGCNLSTGEFDVYAEHHTDNTPRTGKINAQLQNVSNK